LPLVADHFTLSAAASTTAGQTVSLTLTAFDHYGNIATGYTGTVTLASSDPQGVLPASYTFTAADNGTHAFDAALLTAGTQSIKATDGPAWSSAPRRGLWLARPQPWPCSSTPRGLSQQARPLPSGFLPWIPT